MQGLEKNHSLAHCSKDNLEQKKKTTTRICTNRPAGGVRTVNRSASSILLKSFQSHNMLQRLTIGCPFPTSNTSLVSAHSHNQNLLIKSATRYAEAVGDENRDESERVIVTLVRENSYVASSERTLDCQAFSRHSECCVLEACFIICYI